MTDVIYQVGVARGTPVEEWLVELLDTLFDNTFMQPERQRQKIPILNVKLTAAGKPTMSLSTPTSGS